MSSPTTSLVRVDASKVKEIAQKIHSAAIRARKQKREEYILEVIRKNNARWIKWREIGWTDAGFIVDEELNGWGFRAYPWENECREEFGLSSRLLAAVDLALDNELWLNLKDAEIVQKWMAEEKDRS